MHKAVLSASGTAACRGKEKPGGNKTTSTSVKKKCSLFGELLCELGTRNISNSKTPLFTHDLLS